MSSGSGQNDLEKMSRILEAVPQVKFICLDVANGYSEHFVEFVKLVRSKFPEHTIMVGLMGRLSRKLGDAVCKGRGLCLCIAFVARVVNPQKMEDLKNQLSFEK